MAKVTQDWDRDGFLIIEDAKTLKRYQEISNEQPNCDELGIFFAFSNKQFEEGYNKLISLGHIKDGDKVFRGTAGSFGTKQGFDKLYAFYNERQKRIAAECDPQEVYYYEYNNHECCINWDGDLEPIKIIIDTFGVDAARKIQRLRAMDTIDDIISGKAS